LRKVAILGTAPGWEDAPFNDPAWEIWGISRLYHHIPRWDVWFELHPLEEVCETWAEGDKVQEANQRQVYQEWLKSQEKPIYVNEERPDLVPAGIRFPREEIQRWAGKFNPNAEIEEYFSNSISWLLAFALMQDDVDEVGVYGVDMALQEEYMEQRPSCEYFIGLGRGMGKPVHITERSDLLKTFEPYGFGSNSFRKKMKHKLVELKQKRLHVKQQLAEGQAVLHAVEGQMQLTDHIEKDGLMKPEQIAAMREALMGDHQKISGQLREGEKHLAAIAGNIDMLDYQMRNWF